MLGSKTYLPAVLVLAQNTRRNIAENRHVMDDLEALGCCRKQLVCLGRARPSKGRGLLLALNEQLRLTGVTHETRVDGSEPEQVDKVPRNGRHVAHVQVRRVDARLQHSLETCCEQERELHHNRVCKEEVHPGHDQRLGHEAHEVSFGHVEEGVVHAWIGKRVSWISFSGFRVVLVAEKVCYERRFSFCKLRGCKNSCIEAEILRALVELSGVSRAEWTDELFVELQLRSLKE